VLGIDSETIYIILHPYFLKVCSSNRQLSQKVMLAFFYNRGPKYFRLSQQAQ